MNNEIINRVKSNNNIITLADGETLHVGSPDVIHHGFYFFDIDQNEPAVLNHVEQLTENDDWETVSFIEPEKETLEFWTRKMTDTDGNIWELTLTIETENDNDNTDYVYSADWSEADCKIIENNTDYIGYNAENGRNTIEAVEDVLYNEESEHDFELTADWQHVAGNNDLRVLADFDILEKLAESENPLETLGNHIRAILVNSYDASAYSDNDPTKQLIADNAGIWHASIDGREARI